MISYFVSAENIAYHHWQLELLIESFKHLNLENSLTIALAENQEPNYVNYTRNLSSHKNVFIHENVGRKSNCLAYNRIYSLYAALTKRIINQPVIILHPDTILIKPLEPLSYDITFQMDESFKEPKLELLNEIRAAKEIKWIPLGDTICLQNVSLEFLRRVLEVTNYLTKTTNDAEKLAWVITLLEYYGHLTYHGSFGIENILLDHELKYVIHYKHGLPPVFDKRMFRFEPPDVLGLGDPYEILMQHNPTKITDFVQKIVEHCRKKRVNLTNPDFNIPLVNVK